MRGSRLLGSGTPSIGDTATSRQARRCGACAALRAGQTVAALRGAAARDPAVFDTPDELDVGRSPNPHLGFGAGVHYCLGAPLARIEVAAALDALLNRLPGLVPEARG